MRQIVGERSIALLLDAKAGIAKRIIANDEPLRKFHVAPHGLIAAKYTPVRQGGELSPNFGDGRAGQAAAVMG